ncbi:hypothetical protein diail_4200 [Diaporthe ilicicola]|nr:hypothetical protein diail_4200 [Diaporthe ilicicola]
MALTRSQARRSRVIKPISRSSYFFTTKGPSALKPISAITKTTTKQSKKDLKKLPFIESTTSPRKHTAAIKTRAMAAEQTKEKPADGTTIPKQVIVQYTLRVTAKPGAKMNEVEEAIRNIESPCRNGIWSASETKKTQLDGPAGSAVNGSGAAREETLEINLIHNDCSDHDVAPWPCKMNRLDYRIRNGVFPPPHREAMKIEDILGAVRGMTGLVASCEVMAEKSWSLNAVSHLRKESIS